MKLLVLAGGLGTRLRSVLPDTPKAMAPIGATPLLQLQLENWLAQGVSSFAFLLRHQASTIVEYVEKARTGVLKGCEVEVLIETSPMDTGGAIANAVRSLRLERDFLVANADSWLSAGIGDLMSVRSPAMAIVHLSHCGRYGQVQVDDRNIVCRFDEKTAADGPGWINAGLYRLSPDVFSGWNGERLSLERAVFPTLVELGNLLAVPAKADFIDIGVPEDYRRFSAWIQSGKSLPL